MKGRLSTFCLVAAIGGVGAGPGYTVSGPAGGDCSTPAAVTFGLSGKLGPGVVANVTPDDGAGGTFSPAVVRLSDDRPLADAVYTPRRHGARVVTGTNDRGLADGAMGYLARVQVGASGTAPYGIRTPDLGGAQLLNGDLAELRRDVRCDKVHPDSGAMLAYAGARTISILFFPSTQRGGNSLYGMPVNVVRGDAASYPIDVTGYPKSSDVGPVPMDPATTVFENHAGPLPQTKPWPKGSSDHHALIVVRDEATGEPVRLWETYQAFWDPVKGRWSATSAATWDLRTGRFRPAGWASTDAAGLPITPLLVRKDEALRGRIDHAVRITIPAGASRNRCAWPARACAYVGSQSAGIPMGARLRLSEGWYAANRGAFDGDSAVVLDALRRYGAIVADITGSPAWQICGVADERWSLADVLRLQTVPVAAFEVIDFGPGWSFEGPATGKVGVTQRYTVRRIPDNDHNFNFNAYLQEDGVNRDWKNVSDATPEVTLSYTPKTAGVHTLTTATSNIPDLAPPPITFTATP